MSDNKETSEPTSTETKDDQNQNASAPAAPKSLEFNGVWVAQMTGFKGLFKMLPTAIGWQPSPAARSKHHATYSPKTLAMPASDVTEICWIQVTQSMAQVKLSLKGAAELRFSGFPAREQQKFEQFVKTQMPNVNFTLGKAALSGHNWGNISFTPSACAFEPGDDGDDEDGRIAFEIPCSAISQCVIPPASKNEVSIEFFTDKPDNVAASVCDGDHQLTGLRLYIGSKEEGAARTFQKRLVDRAQIGDLTGKGITMLSGLKFVTPRGSYDMELFPQFLTLHGTSFDFRIQYNQIVKLTALDKPNSYTDVPTPAMGSSDSGSRQSVSEYYFVISLDPQLRQGKQTYAHLVLVVDNQKKITLQANLTPEVSEKWPSLKSEMESTVFGHIGTLLCTVTKRSLTTTGSFRTSQGSRFIKCASRSNDGSLYLLEAAMMFVPRPPVLIRYEDIKQIELDRISAMDRTFDFTVILRSNNAKHHFTSIPRRDYDDFSGFLLKKDIKLVRKNDDTGVSNTRINDDDDEMSSSDEEYDAKEEAKKRRAENGEGGDDDDDDGDYEEDDDDDDDDDYDEDIDEDELKAIGSTAQPAAKRSRKDDDGKKESKDEEKKSKKEKEGKKKKDDDDDGGDDKKHKHHHHHHKHKHKHDKKDKKEKKEKSDKKED